MTSRGMAYMPSRNRPYVFVLLPAVSNLSREKFKWQMLRKRKAVSLFFPLPSLPFLFPK